MAIATSPLLASLEQAWDSCRTSADPLRDEYERGMFLLFASSDDDVVAALSASPWLRARLGARDWSIVCTPLETARINGWMARVLASFIAGSGTSAEVVPFIEQLRHCRSPGLTQMLAMCMRRHPLRAVTTRTLAQLKTPAAWAALRQHDGPDLDAELRLQAALHDPTRPRSGLRTLLGPQPDREARYRVVHQAMTHLGSPDEPDLIASILQCLDDGFEVANVLHTLARKGSPTVHRRLFERLWPVAQAQAPNLPWPAIDLYRFHDALVRTAPAPDLLSILLDTLEEPTHTEALFTAIAQRPDPSLVPALSRWSTAHKTKVEQRVVSRALDACRTARPWAS